MMKKLLLMLLAFVATLAFADFGGQKNVITTGNGMTQRGLNRVAPPKNADTVPITSMRPGKIYIDNVFPTPKLGSNLELLDDPGSDTIGGWPGYTTPNQPGRNTGSFREACSISHYAYDDPIVYPGQAGITHLHAFFGNTSMSGVTTASTIRAEGNSTCQGGSLNKSGYWVPAMIDTRTGKVVTPVDDIGVYYKARLSGGFNPADTNDWIYSHNIVSLPLGFKMISGNPANTDANSSRGVWVCRDETTSSGNRKSIPTNCGAGTTAVLLEIPFPDCWNNVDLDSPGHNSHVAFGDTNLGCPAGFPVPIPGITYNIAYPIPNPKSDTQYWRLSSDNYSTSLPAGASAHGDWFNGWKRNSGGGINDIMEMFVENCLRRGNDCHNHLIGPSTAHPGQFLELGHVPNKDKPPK